MRSAGYIRRLDGDRECIEALAWLSEHAKRYPSGGFTPPLTRKKASDTATSFIAVSLRSGRKSLLGAGARLASIEWSDGASDWRHTGSDQAIADACIAGLFTKEYHGYLMVTAGKKRAALDVWLDSQGPLLLRRGFTLQPCLSAGGVSWVIVRKGRLKWTLTYFETMTGVSPTTGLSLAGGAASATLLLRRVAASLFSAVSAVSRVYLSTFGAVLAPTASMIALASVRRTLPADFRKWRPAPLLVAMQREGKGYKGGLTWASRHRGRTVRIDVTRQYTHCLTLPLPHQWAFGGFPGFSSSRIGVYMCRVVLDQEIPYPLGIWCGPDDGFQIEMVRRGEYVCVLHTPEIRLLIELGARVIPSYGYTATATFTLADHVERIQAILTEHGRDAAISKLTKPLGNMVYGKLGQRPGRMELLYSEDNPGKEWYPYYDDLARAWENVWEKPVVKHTSTQHCDIAGMITAYARVQTVRTWASLLASGATVVRCHTDSLTTTAMDATLPLSDGSVIGAWRVESESGDSIIVGANAYADEGGVHIAGVSDPTFEMVDRMLDGHIVGVQQRMKSPRRGFERGETMSERKMRATGD